MMLDECLCRRPVIGQMFKCPLEDKAWSKARSKYPSNDVISRWLALKEYRSILMFKDDIEKDAEKVTSTESEATSTKVPDTEP